MMRKKFGEDIHHHKDEQILCDTPRFPLNDEANRVGRGFGSGHPLLLNWGILSPVF
jgi:hypothetical protein